MFILSFFSFSSTWKGLQQPKRRSTKFVKAFKRTIVSGNHLHSNYDYKFTFVNIQGRQD